PAADHVLVRVVGDQAGRTFDLAHHLVARVYAQAALDAFELQPLANVDALRTHDDALLAVDAVAAPFPAVALAMVAARIAAIRAIGDDQRVLVGQRRLNARPRAHIGADLLAHRAGQRIGGEGEKA